MTALLPGVILFLKTGEKSPGSCKIRGHAGEVMPTLQGTRAEKVGFEPTNGFTRYTISSRAPSTKLGDFSLAACSKIEQNYISILLEYCQVKVFN